MLDADVRAVERLNGEGRNQAEDPCANECRCCDADGIRCSDGFTKIASIAGLLIASPSWNEVLSGTCGWKVLVEEHILEGM